MIDATKLKDSWGWETTSTPGVIKRKVGSAADGGTTGETTYTLPSTTTAGQTTGGGTMDTSGFNFPSQWGEAEDVWRQMASGNYSNTGMDWLSNLLGSGGSQAALKEWGAAQQPAMMDQYSNMVKQMAEQAGVGGTRYSSGLQNQIANYGGQLQNQYQSNLMDRWLQAQGQDVGVANQLAQLGLGTQQTGAEGLFGLGNAQAQLPLQVSSLMSGLGNQLSGQDLSWASLLGPLTGNQYAQPQTYTPTGFQDFLRTLSATLPTNPSAYGIG